MGLASAAELVYLRAVRTSLLLAVSLAAATIAASPVRADEQRIEQLTPPAEQRVEVLGGTEDQQRVDALDDTKAQEVAAHEPPSAGAKAASTAGKFVLGVTAAVVAVGVTVASLLFL